MANRVDTLKYDTTNYASGFVYNAASQVESLNVGSQITESYTFDGSTGLLFEQEAKKGSTAHLKLAHRRQQVRFRRGQYSAEWLGESGLHQRAEPDGQ